MRTALLAFTLLTACKDPADGVCDTMCKELVQTCAYAAYPSFDSCMQGCLYADDQGSDIKAEQKCVRRADCDTFTIVECEHTYGPGD